MIPRLLQPRKIEPRRIVPRRIGGPVGPILWDAVAGLWQFNGDAKDSSPHGRDGTIVEATPGNVTFVDGHTGDQQAIQFTEDGDYVQVHNDAAFKLPSRGTVAAWIYIYPLISHLYMIADITRASQSNGGWYLAIDNRSGIYTKALRFIRSDGGSLEQLNVSNAVVAGWNWVGATWDRTRSNPQTRVFVDGLKVGDLNTSYAGGSPTVDLLLGAGSPDNFTLIGRQQKTYIATEALTDADMLRLYNGEAPQDV